MRIRFAVQGPGTALEPLPGTGDLGDALVAMGALLPGDLARTRARILRHRVRLADALHLLNGLSRDLIAEAEAARLGTVAVDPVTERPDPRLMLSWGPERCLADGLLPLRRLGDVTLVATARPEEIGRHLPALERSFGPVRLVTAAEDRLQAAVERGARRTLSHRAETRVRAEDSSRGWQHRRNGALALSCLALGGLAAVLVPGVLFLALLLLASAAMALGTGLKLVAALATLRPLPPAPAQVVAAEDRPCGDAPRGASYRETGDRPSSAGPPSPAPSIIRAISARHLPRGGGR